MAAKSTAIQHRAPFVSLWSRDDVRTAVVDFLPTKAVAALPEVAKPIRAAQTPLLITAIRRRGKTTVPSPQTTRALLDALFVGEPQYFCENWEDNRLEHWEEDAPVGLDEDYPLHFSSRAPDYRTRYLELIRDDVADDDTGWGTHSGLSRRIRGRNLLVTRFRITMIYYECDDGGAVGYAVLRGPPGTEIIGPRFDSESYDEGGYRLKLLWLDSKYADTCVLVEDPSPQISYRIDARFHHDVTGYSRVDISVNGRLVIEGQSFACRPFERLHLYNFSRGTSHIGPIEVWYEKAAPNQAWHTGNE